MPFQQSILIESQYLPPIQYFSKLVQYATIFIEQQEHYAKGSYRNRCEIATANGILALSIPLQKGKNEQQPIRAVRIAYHEPWQRLHWESIRSAYGNAPFFEFYEDALKPFFQTPYEFLFDFNWALLQLLLQLLGLRPNLGLTQRFEQPPPPEVLDFRDALSPKAHRRQPDPHFQPRRYAQVFEEKHGFLPNLSILDLLFCTGPEAISFLQLTIKHPTVK